MSRLEGRAKPILAPLIGGRGEFLSSEQQFIAATWATKTAIVVEATLSVNADNFTLDEAGIVMRQDRPPASANVLIAAVVGWIPPLHYSAAKAAMYVNRNPVCKFHFHNVQIGALVFQVVRRIPPPADYGALRRFPVPREIELPFDVASYIFPPSDRCEWPPKKPLDWQGLEGIGTRNIDMPEDWHLENPAQHPGDAT